MLYHEGLWNNCNAIEYKGINENGTINDLRFVRLMGSMPRTIDFSKIVGKMLEYIAI